MSSRTLYLGRRQFVQASLAAGGAILFGCGENTSRHFGPESATGSYFNAWLEFSRDNTIILTLDKAEMGQGVRDAFAIIVAGAMGLDPAIVETEFAALGNGKRNPVYTPTWGTAGSSSVRTLWRPLRHAGALARLMFCRAAASIWQVDERECFLMDIGVHHHPTSRQLSFAELLDRVNELPVPDTIDLTSPKIALPATPRSVAAQYGIDFLSGKIPVALVIKPPIAGAKLPSSEWAEIKQLPGILDCFAVPSGLAIVANGFWRVQQAAKEAIIEWVYPDSPTQLDTSDVRRVLKAALDAPGFVAEERGEAFSGKTLIAATYCVPYLTHAALEPLSCAILINPEGWSVHVGTQRPQAALAALAAISGLSEDRISLQTGLIGSSFGRRLQLDFIAEAGHVAARYGSSVKLIWPREDDMTGGHYRPAMAAHFRVVDDNKGALHWLARVASCESWPFDRHSVAARLKYRWQSLKGGASFGQALEGLTDCPYDFPNRRFEIEFLDLPISTGQWRSTGNSFNTFFLESAIDEVAFAQHRDPVELRMALLGDQARVSTALKQVRSIAHSWVKPPSSGLGFACHLCYESAVAMAVQVSVVAGRVDVLRMVCAVDCGLVIDPDGVRKQIEGGALFGLCAALYGEVVFEDGRVTSTNFDRYRVLRMAAVPAIEVVLLPGGDAPGGVGEVATPLAAPALCNAIFAASGHRARNLPVLDASSGKLAAKYVERH